MEGLRQRLAMRLWCWRGPEFWKEHDPGGSFLAAWSPKDPWNRSEPDPESEAKPLSQPAAHDQEKNVVLLQGFWGLLVTQRYCCCSQFTCPFLGQGREGISVEHPRKRAKYPKYTEGLLPGYWEGGNQPVSCHGGTDSWFPDMAPGAGLLA